MLSLALDPMSSLFPLGLSLSVCNPKQTEFFISDEGPFGFSVECLEFPEEQEFVLMLVLAHGAGGAGRGRQG